VPERAFADLPILDELAEQLFTAAPSSQRQPLRWRGPRRSLALAVVLCLVIAAGAAAATLLVLRGSVIPAPNPRDVPPEQTPAPGTSRLEPLRIPDPDGGPPWALRVARSQTGQLCATVGQVIDGDFGLIGLDGRFRSLPERIVDACSVPRADKASLIGARVFDAPQPGAVRTVVNGIAGHSLRRVQIEAGGRRSTAQIAPDGTFLAVLRGYPEALQLRVTLTFADGHRETHPFGLSPYVVPDPDGEDAWRTSAGGIGGSQALCINFQPARAARNPAISPAACGDLGQRRRRGVFFAVRRVAPGAVAQRGGSILAGHWGDHSARTAVWGAAGSDVKRIEIVGPGTQRQQATIAPSAAFLVVLPASVDPRSLTVVVTYTDGRVARYRGSTNLVSHASVRSHASTGGGP